MNKVYFYHFFRNSNLYESLKIIHEVMDCAGECTVNYLLLLIVSCINMLCFSLHGREFRQSLSIPYVLFSVLVSLAVFMASRGYCSIHVSHVRWLVGMTHPLLRPRPHTAMLTFQCGL